MPAPRAFPRRPSAPGPTAPSAPTPPLPGRPGRATHWCARLLALAGAVLVLAGTALVAVPRPAAAEVVHGQGWSATVAGWDSWYGSYGMGELGTAWCIDHGSAAPDAAFGYVPADLSGVPAGTQAAMAWALGTTGPDPGPVDAAALMLVLHDLMGATYPAGPLDVATLTADDLAGFGGAEGDVVAAARALAADAMAHAGVRGPLAMAATVDEVAPGEDGVHRHRRRRRRAWRGRRPGPGRVAGRHARRRRDGRHRGRRAGRLPVHRRPSGEPLRGDRGRARPRARRLCLLDHAGAARRRAASGPPVGHGRLRAAAVDRPGRQDRRRRALPSRGRRALRGPRGGGG